MKTYLVKRDEHGKIEIIWLFKIDDIIPFAHFYGEDINVTDKIPCCGRVKTTKRGWTITTYGLNGEPVKIFLDRRKFKEEKL